MRCETSLIGHVCAHALQIISYSNPTVSDVRGSGTQSPTAGNSSVQILGTNFGAVGTAKTVLAWASPSNTQLTFAAHDCRVVQDHILINCSTASGVGTALSWQVYVDGLNSTTPLTSYLPPTVTAVSLSSATASTLGGTVVIVDGDNFGQWSQLVSVDVHIGTAAAATVNAAGVATLQSPNLLASAKVLPTTSCNLTVLHRQLQCFLPAGVGILTAVSVSVLGQSTVFTTTNLTYALPVVTTVSPQSWSPSSSTGTSATLTGSGFGSSSSDVKVPCCREPVRAVS